MTENKKNTKLASGCGFWSVFAFLSFCSFLSFGCNIAFLPKWLSWGVFLLSISTPMVLFYKQSKSLWGQQHPHLFRKRYFITIFMLTYVTLTAVTQSVFNQTDKSLSTNNDIDTNETVVERKPLPFHQVVYKIDNYRADGGTNLFVLVAPPNLSSTEYQNDLKQLVDYFVTKFGPKTSIDFYDDKKALEIGYITNVSHSRMRTRQDEKILSTHSVASFSGDLEGMIYLNELDHFPATDTSNPKVGKFVDSEEYNPMTYEESTVEDSSEVTPSQTVDLQAENEKKERKYISDTISEMKGKGFVMSIAPETHTISVNPSGWMSLNLQEKEKITRFLGDYCQYYCESKRAWAKIKNGYTGEDLSEAWTTRVKILQ